jgi:hypothetical protein
MSQTFNLGGLGDNKLTKLIFSNGTANTCSVFLDNDGYLVFKQSANTITFPLGDLPADKRLAIENGRVVAGKLIGAVGGTDGGGSETDTDIISSFYPTSMNAADNLSNYPGFANAMLFENNSSTPKHKLERTFQDRSGHSWSWSSWVKFSDPTSHNFIFSVLNSAGTTLALEAGVNAQKIRIYTNGGDNMQTALAEISDVSAWYHILFTFDVTNSVLLAPNQQKIEIYINNYSPTVTKNGSSLSHVVNSNVVHRIGLNHAANGLEGYLANIQFIDGQALDPSYFGQYMKDSNGNPTNAWVPKLFDGTSSTGGTEVANDYGANGFLLDFSKLGLDGSGDIDKVYDTAPISGSHSAANDWTAH